MGTVFVPLAPVIGREQVVTAIANALGLVLYAATDRADQLIASLHEKELLLVLDNFEHLLIDSSCVALISDLLHGAPTIKLLATSREPLRLQAEWVFEVQGLPVPESATLDVLEANSAAKLFLQRAQQARVGFTMTADDRQAVWQICQLVEGLPLGIELAAAWVSMLSCQEIADEIQRNVDFLTTDARDVSDRHRSIRAVFDHSWALLSDEEQRVLRQLSVFRGGFGREAAEYVAGASLALLSMLVSKSLLRRAAAGRYDMHDLVRQYALGHLHQDAPECAQTRARHCAYYAALLQRRGDAFKGSDQPSVVTELIAEIANLRLAWDWASTHALADELSQAADTLFWLYESQSNCREGIPLFGQAVQSLQAAVGSATSPATDAGWGQRLALGQALSYQGFFCFRQGQHPQGRALLERSVALLQPMASTLPARIALSNAIVFLGMVTYMMGEYPEGRHLLEKSLAMKRMLDDRWGAAVCLRHLGLAAYSLGEYDESYRVLSESLALSRTMGNPWSIAFSLNFLGMAAYAQGAHDQARQILSEGLALSQSLKDRYNIASALRGLGMVNQAQGHSLEAQHCFCEAQQCFEDSIAIWREIGEQGNLAQTLNQLGSTLLTLEDRSRAWHCFREALQVAMEAQIAPVMLEALLGMAVLRAKVGAVDTALELLMHILQNPATTQDARRRAEHLRAELEASLSTQEIEVIAARARNKTLEVLSQEMLASLNAY